MIAFLRRLFSRRPDPRPRLNLALLAVHMDAASPKRTIR